MPEAPARGQFDADGRWRPGTPVAVRNRYTATWSKGFVIAGTDGGRAYRLKRASDGAVLPEPFSPQELREV